MVEIIYSDDLSFLLSLFRHYHCCCDLNFKRFVYRGFSVDCLFSNHFFNSVYDIDCFIDCFYAFEKFEMPDTSDSFLFDGDVPF